MEPSTAVKRGRGRKRKAEEAFHKMGDEEEFPDKVETLASKRRKRVQGAGARNTRSEAKKKTSMPAEEKTGSEGRGRKRRAEEAFQKEDEEREFPEQKRNMAAPERTKRTQRAGASNKQRDTEKNISSPGEEKSSSGGRGRKRKAEEAFHKMEDEEEFPDKVETLASKRRKRVQGAGARNTRSEAKKKTSMPAEEKTGSGSDDCYYMAEPPLQTGVYLQKYEVGKKLKRNIWEGIRKSDGLKVAIKFVAQDEIWCIPFYSIEGYDRPLLAEIAALLKLNRPPLCPHVQKIYEWFEEPTHYVLILEYFYPWMSLIEFIRRKGGRLRERVARPIMLQVMIAIHFCMERRVFHKGLHVENILIDPETMQIMLINIDFCSILKDLKVIRELMEKRQQEEAEQKSNY